MAVDAKHDLSGMERRGHRPSATAEAASGSRRRWSARDRTSCGGCCAFDPPDHCIVASTPALTHATPTIAIIAT